MSMTKPLCGLIERLHRLACFAVLLLSCLVAFLFSAPAFAAATINSATLDGGTYSSGNPYYVRPGQVISVNLNVTKLGPPSWKSSGADFGYGTWLVGTNCADYNGGVSPANGTYDHTFTSTVPPTATDGTILSANFGTFVNVSCGGAGAGDSLTWANALVVDDTPPYAISILRADANPTGASTVSWTVTFSESVSAVDSGDFDLAEAGGVSGATFSSVTGSGTTWTVTANTGIGNGTLGLNLVDNDTIVDRAGNPLVSSGGASDGSLVGQVYIINRVSDFNAFETSTAAGAISGVIKTKIAGSSFSLDVVAISNSAQSAGFSGTVKVELLGNTTTGISLDADNCPTSFTLQQTVSPNPTISGGRSTVSFAAVSNAWKDVRVRISYPTTSPTVTSCSTDNFAIRPDTLGAYAAHTDWETAGTTVTLNNAAASGTPIHKAGRNFTLVATGYNTLSAVTGNYDGSPIAASVATIAPATVTGSFSVGTFVVPSPVTGTVRSDTATYDEVGPVSLILQDQNFAAVDAADTDGDCTATGRYVCSETLSVGRFVPDHFALTRNGSAAPTLLDRQDIGTCYAATTGSISLGSNSLTVISATGLEAGDQVAVAGAGAGGAELISSISSIAGTTLTLGTAASATVTGVPVRKTGFTYMDEPLELRFQLAAQNTANATTLNYAGSLAKLNLGTPASFSVGAISGTTQLTSRVSLVSSSGSWSAGQTSGVAVVLALSSLTAPATPRTGAADGPYATLDFGIRPIDSDSVALTPYDLDADADSTNERAKIARTAVRFGRLRLANAHGSELLALPIPISVQYWNGTLFTTNTLDSCTSLSDSNIGLGNYKNNLASGETSVNPATISFASGVGTMRLTAPGAGNSGSVDVCVDLGSDPVGGVVCSATASAGKSYLQGKWAPGTGWDNDPKVRATFGVYKNANEFIYLREMY